MTDLVEFLRARLDEDQQYARAMIDGAMRGVVAVSGTGLPDARAMSVVERWANSRVMPPTDAARALAEVKTKRQIIETVQGAVSVVAVSGTVNVGDRVLRLLALPYADHPDYRSEWKP